MAFAEIKLCGDAWVIQMPIRRKCSSEYRISALQYRFYIRTVRFGTTEDQEVYFEFFF